eukprot:scaffold2349_cov110-Cylindrotheca_fusiformis.AAC.7
MAGELIETNQESCCAIFNARSKNFQRSGRTNPFYSQCRRDAETSKHVSREEELLERLFGHLKKLPPQLFYRKPFQIPKKACYSYFDPREGKDDMEYVHTIDVERNQWLTDKECLFMKLHHQGINWSHCRIGIVFFLEGGQKLLNKSFAFADPFIT